VTTSPSTSITESPARLPRAVLNQPRVDKFSMTASRICLVTARDPGEVVPGLCRGTGATAGNASGSVVRVRATGETPARELRTIFICNKHRRPMPVAFLISEGCAQHARAAPRLIACWPTAMTVALRNEKS